MIDDQSVGDDVPIIYSRAIHIDTVKLSQRCPTNNLPSKAKLIACGGEGFTINKRSGLTISGIIFRPSRKGLTEPFIKVIWFDNETAVIEVEVSIAKMIDSSGLGVHSSSDIHLAVANIEEHALQRIKLPFSAGTATVVRLDANADFLVGDDLAHLITKTIVCDDSRLKVMGWNESTRVFSNSSRRLKIYNKSLEMMNEYRKGKVSFEAVQQSRGVVRIEISLSRRAVKRFATRLKVNNTVKHLISLSTAETLVRETLVKLCLDEPKIAAEGVEALMAQKFGPEAVKLLGFWSFRRTFPHSYIKLLRLPKSTDYRMRKRLREAGLLDASPGITSF